MIGRTADKIRSLEHFSKAKDACNALELDGLVLVGGNITNTDSAHLAEYFASEGMALLKESNAEDILELFSFLFFCFYNIFHD